MNIGALEVGLGAREEAGEAVLLALGVLVGVLLGTASLVAVRSALGGLVDLRSVGARVAHARGLARYIACVALLDAADLRREAGGCGRGRSAGDGGRLGEDAGSKSENGNGVLHVDFDDYVASNGA